MVISGRAISERIFLAGEADLDTVVVDGRIAEHWPTVVGAMFDDDLQNRTEHALQQVQRFTERRPIEATVARRRAMHDLAPQHIDPVEDKHQ
jgi:hypothetical protein